MSGGGGARDAGRGPSAGVSRRLLAPLLRRLLRRPPGEISRRAAGFAPGGPGYRERLDRLGAAFIAGYREIRSHADTNLDVLRLFAGVHAACSLVSIDRALGTPHGDEAEWLVELRATLRDMARAHRDLAVAVAEAQ